MKPDKITVDGTKPSLRLSEATRDRATAIGLSAFFFGTLISITLQDEKSVLLLVAATCLSFSPPLLLTSACISALQLDAKTYTSKSHSWQSNLLMVGGAIGLAGIGMVLWEFYWIVGLSFALASVCAIVAGCHACVGLIQERKTEEA